MTNRARGAVPGWRTGWLAAATFVLTVTGLRAQSTASLGGIEPRLRVELSAGASAQTIGGNQLNMALVALRWHGDDAIGFRLWAFWSDLDRSDCAQPLSPCPAALEFIGAGVSADLSSTLGRHTTLALSAGAGKASPRQLVTNPYGFGEERWTFLAGVALRHKRLVVETHFLLLGGDAYIPATVGLRF